MSVFSDQDVLLISLVAMTALTLVLSGVAVGGLMILWWRHVGVVARVTRLETRNESALTHEELRRLHERMATVEGQVNTTNRLLGTVQQFLLEKD